MMLTERDYQTDLQQLRQALTAQSDDAGSLLLDFAERFTDSTDFNDSALILRLNLTEIESDEHKLEIYQEMSALLDQMTAETQASSQIEFQQKLEHVNQHYKQTPLPNATVLLAEGLEKSYPGTSFGLGPVEVELKQGEITGLVGQNAHGKTTLLRMLAGDLRQDKGLLSYPLLHQSGNNIDWIEVKSRLAYLPQELPRWHGSLADNLRYQAALHGILGKDNDREVNYIVERLDLGDYLDLSWSQLSGGYKLRFALAQVLVWKPQILIMDEPLANLDVKAQTHLLQDVSELTRSLRYPMAVMMSSQHLHELEAVSSKIMFLRDGEVIYSGPVSNIGAEFDYNLYEIGTDADLRSLNLLQEAGYLALDHNGVSYVLKTSTEIDQHQLLERLLTGNITFDYFRDISRSSKRLFV